ncbi:MAG: septum formation family protein [Propionicimonas sp.]|uniref:septum formation family protein n=1 Tax=Propionicimonas sp. TaxID=1955623 RepID=UPI003D0D03C5
MGSVRVGVVAAALAVVALGGCASTPGARDSAGQVTAPTTTDTYSVRVGDCLAKLPTESTDALNLLPCGEAHYWEAFASVTLTGDAYPGDSVVRTEAEKACDAAFTGFVGVTAAKSKLDLTMLTPTKETWTQASDREVVCLVGSAAGGVTGTLKDSAR